MRFRLEVEYWDAEFNSVDRAVVQTLSWESLVHHVKHELEAFQEWPELAKENGALVADIHYLTLEVSYDV